ncbi:MAG: MFS transporter [Chloroflexi bacterium]|nr:MFS transporter [Chloroflexota bacterium]
MRRLSAYPMYLISEGAFALFFSMIITVNMVYQVEIARLNPLQLVLVGTVLEATVFLCETPTGIVADIYSRRLSIIVGTVMMGLGFMLEGTVPRFETILLAQVIWGLGYTFTSGATQAWITDEIGEDKAGRAFLRASQVGQMGDLAGIGISVLLAGIFLQLPIILGGLLVSVLGIFQMLFMPETGFKPAPRENRNSWQQMGHTFRGGLQMMRRRPALITIFGTIAIYGAFSEGFDRLWTPHLLDNFTLPTLDGLQPVAWFGVIRAAGILLAVVATEVARRRLDTNNHRSVARALFGINALIVAGVMAFGLATSFVPAFLVLLAIIPLRRLTDPIQAAWVNQRLEPSVRATVISMSGQADAFGQIIGGPILGVIATLATIRVEMVAAALMLAPALLLYAWTMREREAEPALVTGD